MPLSDWQAAVVDVGAILRARTTDSNGVEHGTFTADTRPTQAEVEILLEGSNAEVADAVGEDLDPKFRLAAKRVAALGAALEVELSYWPEEVANGRSPYDQLKALYDDRLAKLITAVAEGQTEVDDNPVGGYGSPSYGFPVDMGGMVGWGTQW